MTYETFAPPPNLAPFVKCYWMLESPAEQNPERQRIVPDGCFEMIFHYGDLYRQYNPDGSSLIQPRCFVIGQLTEPLEIEPTGISAMFSVRFNPGGFMPFATLPLKQMENKAVPIADLFGAEGLILQHDMLAAEDTLSRIRIAELFLTTRAGESGMTDRLITETLDTMLSANGQLSVEEITVRLNINRRKLERRFTSAIGISPKQLSKIIRLQATLRLLQSKQFTNLTELAHAGEYYDQAHFIKDFKEFTGLTPKEFYSSNLKISSFFYGSD